MDEVFANFLMVEQEVVELLVLVVIFDQSLLGLIGATKCLGDAEDGGGLFGH